MKNFLLIFFALMAYNLNAQVTGKVVDGNGEPLFGASVVEAGTYNGTTTDLDGMFTLNTSSANPSVTISLPRAHW